VAAAVGQSITWDSTASPAGAYAFKAVARDATGILATAYSPGEVQVGAPAAKSSCSTGLGEASWGLMLGLLVWVRGRRR
jgi:hypothetical protein